MSPSSFVLKNHSSWSLFFRDKQTSTVVTAVIHQIHQSNLSNEKTKTKKKTKKNQQQQHVEIPLIQPHDGNAGGSLVLIA